jgi:hypothetical protein
MSLFHLISLYFLTPFVVVVQPLRILWGLYLLLRPPAGRYLNRPVLAISIFIKCLSLLLAFYLYRSFGKGGDSFLDSSFVQFMTLPFILYLMSELVARFIHQHPGDKI